MISSRPCNKSFSGFYEFPGGKVKKNEFLMEAVKREIMEELSVKVDINKLIFLCSYQVTRGKKKIDLNFFSTNTWLGNIKALEKQKVKWIRLSEVKCFKMLSSNKKIIDFLNYFLLFPGTNRD
jgi:8-oxo-dGTP diphosphatase